MERRDVGGLLRTDLRIFVGGHDRTKVADGLGWQITAVRAALGHRQVPVHPAVCFVKAEWGLLARPFVHDGVWIGWSKKLAEELRSPGPLDAGLMARVAAQLADCLPSACP